MFQQPSPLHLPPEDTEEEDDAQQEVEGVGDRGGKGERLGEKLRRFCYGLLETTARSIYLSIYLLETTARCKLDVL